MEISNIIIFLACVIFLFLIGKFFVVPLKIILRILGNSILGACIIYIVNLIGGMFEFHIGLNAITTIIVGILGIPRFNFAYYTKIIFVIVEKYRTSCYNIAYQI